MFDLFNDMLILNSFQILHLRLVAAYNTIENTIIEVFWIKLSVQIHNFNSLVCWKDIQETFWGRIFVDTGRRAIAFFEIINTALKTLDFLCALNFLDFVNLLQKYINLFDHKEGILYDWVLINDFNEVDNILIFGFRDIIVNLEEFLNILELCIVFNKLFE